MAVVNTTVVARGDNNGDRVAGDLQRVFRAGKKMRSKGTAELEKTEDKRLWP